MSHHQAHPPADADDDTQPVAAAPVNLCAGMNRFGKPCTNRVSAPRRGLWPLLNKPQPTRPTTSSRPARGRERLDCGQRDRRPTHPDRSGDADLLKLVEVGAKLADHSRATNTQASYRQHWRTFCAFCQLYDLSAGLPVAPEVVAYLAESGRVDPSTRRREGDPLSHGYIRQALGAISHRHTINGYPSPADAPMVRALLEGYAKVHGTDVNGKTPLRIAGLGRIAEALGQPNATSARDLAVCLLATHPDLTLGASALAGLDGTHIQLPERYDDPMILLVGSSGTRALRPIEVQPEPDSAICPVRAMRALAPDPIGPAFRSAPTRRATRQAIKKLVDSAIAAVRVTPSAVIAGFAKLDADSRRRLAAHLTQGRPLDLRDRAIINNLYWGCFRGSELAAMNWRNVTVVDDGIEWRILNSKSDQLGTGATVGVTRHPNPWLCPVIALDDWQNAYQALVGRPVRPDDPVFPTLDHRSRLGAAMERDAINAAVKKAAARAGLVGDYGSHSPRAGFTTDCIDAGIPREHVQLHGRWRSIRSLDPYVRKTSTWGRTNPGMQLAQGQPEPTGEATD